MSDSESDLLPSNVFTFQNENTMISAKGPSVNSTNMSNISFRNNVLTSTMQMPRNFERQRFGEPSFDTRSMYYRRETSPMSMYSGSDMRGRNFHQSYYGGGRSQRSMYYGRSGSPMSMRSMRSMDSNASVSATDIALAFKNVNFNKHDLRMIKDAYNKFMKRRIRKKIEKRRNMRLFLKGYQRKSGYDSGDLGSDSSISSDDCKSTSSAMYKDNMSCRSTRTDIVDFRKSIKDSNMYKDCTDSFKQNAFKNMFSVAPAQGRYSPQNSVHSQNAQSLPDKQFAVPSHKPALTQKDRFRSGYLLPSQRFNRSVASVPILERDPRLQARQNAYNSKQLINNEVPKENGHTNGETDSDQEEIFSEVTVREKSTHNYESQYDKITDHGKRSLEIEDSNRCSDRKRPKLSSPLRQSNKANDLLKEKNTNPGANKKISDTNKKVSEEKIEKCNGNIDKAGNKNTDEFEFLKPQFPVRKSGPAKTKEKLISKSAQPLLDAILPPSNAQTVETMTDKSKDTAPESQPATTEEPSDTTQHSNNDLSMRPSFIKRKLFTQKLDVTEKKNLSSGALNVNSPQTNVYSAIQKEKHKARKLVTNQSCLSRDIAQEGNNLLDLIHKIVPPDRMNMTNVTNKTSISNNLSSRNQNDDDKWDVTSVISTCNNDDVSDTYTDEEIFALDNTKRKVEENVKNRSKETVNKVKQNDKKNNVNKPNDNKKTNINAKPTNECRILIEKLPQNKLASKPSGEEIKQVDPMQENDYNKKSIYNCVKSFWDTDFESDMESPVPKRPAIRSEAVKENQNKSNVMEESRRIAIPKTNKTLNMSLASVSESIKSKMMPTNTLRKFNISKTLSIKSFLTPKHLKSKPLTAKENLKDRVVLEMEDSPQQCNTEPVKKTTKQDSNKKTAKNVDSGKKAEAKKSDKTINGKLLDTPKLTPPQPKTKAKITKASAKANNKTIANITTSATRALRTPKRKACCDEPDEKHNMSTRSSATKSSASKEKEKVKKTAKRNTSLKSNKDVETGNKNTVSKKAKVTPSKSAKTAAKITDTKKNADILDTSSRRAQAEGNKTSRKKNDPLLDTSSKAAKTETKKSNKKNGDLNTSKTNTKTQPKAKPEKAPNAKPITKIVANKSISGLRNIKSPKGKATYNKISIEHNRSTRSSAKKSAAPK